LPTGSQEPSLEKEKGGEGSHPLAPQQPMLFFSSFQFSLLFNQKQEQEEQEEETEEDNEQEEEDDEEEEDEEEEEEEQEQEQEQEQSTKTILNQQEHVNLNL